MVATNTTNYGLIRTVQVRNENIPGVLGALASAIGSAGANIGNIQTVHLSQSYVLRDIDVHVEDETHLLEVLRAVGQVKGVRVTETRDEVMDLHQGGEIAIVSRQPVADIAMLRKVYTPGLIAPEAVRSGQVVFALSNPDPEIRPAHAIEAGAAFAADGTTVNNLLGYPGIWRGALSTQASEINRSMLIAAGEALMEVTPQGDLSPTALDPAVHRRVAYAVGRAAVESGVGDADGLVDLE